LIRNRLHFSYSIACYSASPIILRTPELLDQPITHAPTAPAKAVIKTLAIILAVLITVLGVYQSRRSDPYVQSVLSLTGDPVQGQVIFQLNCAVCHGINGQGLVGPSLSHVASRKSRVGIIEQVISGDTPPMPQFQPSPETMADLLEYLETL
jgi:mono/diheme cytochrome c family protein